MAPEVSIPLREALTDEQRAAIDQWLRTLGRAHHGADFVDGAEQWTLWIDDYGPLGIQCTGASPTQEVLITLRRVPAPTEYTRKDAFFQWTVAEDRRRMRQLLGFDVAYYLDITAAYGGPYVHQVLAHLAIWLARHFEGLIDMQTKIAPQHVWDAELGIGGAAPMPEEARFDAVRAYVRQFPGRVLEMHSWLTPTLRTIWHLVDVEFLEAWMQHPDFYM